MPPVALRFARNAKTCAFVAFEGALAGVANCKRMSWLELLAVAVH